MHFIRLNTLILATLLFLSYGMIANSSTDTKLFRYKDKNGTIVINDNVPPEFSKGGYEILNSRGQVIELVPRQLTDAELNNLSSDEARKRNELKERERLRALDERLLLRYSNIIDIEEARNREIKELQIRLSILRGNVLATKSKIEDYRTKAADMERANRPVPAGVTNKLNMLAQEIERSEASIITRKKEIEEVKAGYQKDIERFKYLLNIKGFNR